jgi:Holliday junction resolvasome RuvABC DNA-binding subunit
MKRNYIVVPYIQRKRWKILLNDEVQKSFTRLTGRKSPTASDVVALECLGYKLKNVQDIVKEHNKMAFAAA